MTAPLTELSIHLELTEAPSTTGIWGNIWFEADDCAFPEKHWSDFAEALLDMWLFTLTDIYSSKNKWYEKDLVFMDGPYEAVLRNSTPVSIHFRDRHDDSIVGSFCISLPALARQGIAHRRQVLAYMLKFSPHSKYRSKESECAWLETLVQQAQTP